MEGEDFRELSNYILAVYRREFRNLKKKRRRGTQQPFSCHNCARDPGYVEKARLNSHLCAYIRMCGHT
jgi:predicted SprT family Zn-dependent metalloprotease